MPPRKSFVTVTDQFCGAGGSSSGAAAAGAEVAMAINHWQLAVETHNNNFPDTAHDCCDISASDPRRYPSTDILITSPECTNHSLSKGKKRKNLNQLDLFNPQPIDPAEERSRATMWDVVRFAEFHGYHLVIVENVVDVVYWSLFDSWLQAMRALDYEHELVFFNSMFAPLTPQSRDRIYIVFWKRKNRRPNLNFKPLAYCSSCAKEVQSVQSWKNPFKRWGRYGKRNQYLYRCPSCTQPVEPYYTPAFTAIDWSLPSQRISDRKKPLSPATLKRIRKGLDKFSGHLQGNSSFAENSNCHRELKDAAPFILTERFNGVHRGVDEPLPTVMAGEGRVHHRLVQPFLTSYYSGSGQATQISDPIPTVSTVDRHALVSPFLVNYYTPRISLTGINDPVATVSTQARTYLAQPTESIQVEDCYFRMLAPEEIHRAMAFPKGYIVLGNKRQRVKQYGNAVTPPVMEMILQRCIATLGH